MGEEGPEPQELMENVEHNAHEQHAGGQHKSKHLAPAVTAAVLAVGASIGSLLSGHAANEAILLQSKASDQWAYYQAKSTKSHLYELNKTLLECIADVNNVENNFQASSEKKAKTREIIDRFSSQKADFEKEKKEIEKEARKLEDESSHEFSKHQMFSFAVACFQIGIVVASVSILVDSGPFLLASIVTGVIALLLLVYGASM